MPIRAAVVAAALAGAITGLIPLYLRLVRRELSRAGHIEDVATSLGLNFSHGDPAFPGSSAYRFPFELFSRGVEQICENFMIGTVEGIQITCFDFLYRQRVDPDGTPDDDVLSEPIRHSVAVTTVKGHRPHVVIEPASATLTSRADGEPVRLEWGAFNEHYRVI